MFTGLVETSGTLRATRAVGTGRELQLVATFTDLVLGESIAHDGVCLTVERSDDRGNYTVTAGEETLRRTTLGDKRAGDTLHLERALRVGDRLGGHLVQGHVDAVGEVLRVGDGRDWLRIDIAAPPHLGRYLVEKGSITVDGVSLTVNEVDGSVFSVGIIPHTMKLTHLAHLRSGSRVNLEVDVIARYVERQLAGPLTGLSVERLGELGFVKEDKWTSR